jgi:hypothetical protein
MRSWGKDVILVVGIFCDSSGRRLLHQKPVLWGFVYLPSVPYRYSGCHELPRKAKWAYLGSVFTHIQVLTFVPFIELIVEVNAKLSLVPKQAPCHADVRGSGGIAVYIHNLGIRLYWMANFTPRSLYLRENNPSTQCVGVYVDTRAALAL